MDKKEIYERIMIILNEDVLNNVDLGIILSRAQVETVAEIMADEFADIYRQKIDELAEQIIQLLN